MQGVPVADATQWEQIEAVARCGYGLDSRKFSAFSPSLESIEFSSH